MEKLIIIYGFASIMRIFGAFLVAWFFDIVIDMFLAFINTINLNR